LKHTHWRTRSFGCVLPVIGLNTHERESQMIGSTYDAQSKMRNGKLKRVTATKQQDDWKQQRRKQRRVRQQEKEHRYGNAREISRRS